LLYDVDFDFIFDANELHLGKEVTALLPPSTKPLNILKAGLQAFWRLTETRKGNLRLISANQSITESDEAEVEMRYDYDCHVSTHAHCTSPRQSFVSRA
jgi:hypothetical protein